MVHLKSNENINTSMVIYTLHLKKQRSVWDYKFGASPLLYRHPFKCATTSPNEN